MGFIVSFCKQHYLENRQNFHLVKELWLSPVIYMLEEHGGRKNELCFFKKNILTMPEDLT